MNLKSAFFIFILSLGAFGVSLYFFPQVFPFVNVAITMDAQTAKQKAHKAAEEFDWKLDETKESHAAVVFDTDENTQFYAELEAGGKDAFVTMFREHLYQPYQWKVRLYQEQEITSMQFMFTPQGDLYGGIYTIPDSTIFPNESKQIIQDRVEDFMHKQGLDTSVYTILSHATDTKKNGRIDHELTYERTDAKLGKAPYRYTVKVAGNTIVSFKHHVHIPEQFAAKYKHMRSYNGFIASFAWLLVFVVYMVGIGLFAFLILYPQRYFLARPAGILASLVAGMSIALFNINSSPLWGFSYQTHQSFFLFMVQKIWNICMVAGIYGLFIWVVAVIAEAATRKVFADHPQLFLFFKLRSWATQTGASAILLGYAVGHSMLLVQLGFVALATKLGAWYPTMKLTDPNILSSYIPAFGPLAMASFAGIFEELLCRALPIAGIFLLFQRSKKSRIAWFFVMCLQAVIFAALHANYPMQPSYLRVVEITPIFIGFGYLYAYFGLLPCIIAHIYYDALLMAIPIFVSSLLLQKALVIGVLSLPLLAVALWYARDRLQGRDVDRNSQWQVPDATQAQGLAFFQQVRVKAVPQWKRIVVWLVAVLSVAWFWYGSQYKAPGVISQVSKHEAIEIAREKVVQKYNLNLDEWTMQVQMRAYTPPASFFVWREFGKEVYNRIFPDLVRLRYWQIRFVTFSGPVQDRLETYTVEVGPTSDLVVCNHYIPEKQELPALSQQQAQSLAEQEILQTYGLDARKQEVRLLAVEPSKISRQDWKFVFEQVNSPISEHKQGSVRIAVHIAGDQVTTSNRFVHVPDAWVHTYKQEVEIRQFISQRIGYAILLVVILALLVLVWYQVYRCWNRSLKTRVMYIAGITVGIAILHCLNSMPYFVAQLYPLTLLSTQYLSIGLSFLQIVGVFTGLVGSVCMLGLSDLYTGFQGRLYILSQVILALAWGVAQGKLWLMVQNFFASQFGPEFPSWLIYESAYLFTGVQVYYTIVYFSIVTLALMVWVVLSYNKSWGWQAALALLAGLVCACVCGITYTGLWFIVFAGVAGLWLYTSMRLLYQYNPWLLVYVQAAFFIFVNVYA